jgi:tetratricopeptide (TPR) repeat protein
MAKIQLWHDWDWAGAERSARRALELAPEDAEAQRICGWLSGQVGRFADAEALLLRSIQSDPLNSDGYIGTGFLYRSMARPVEAERMFRKAIELNPGEPRTRHGLAFVLADQGRHDEALAAATEEPAGWARLTALAHVHHAAGRRAESDRALEELKAKHAKDSGFQIAAVHAGRGEVDAAFEWLERAYQERDAGLSMVKLERYFRSVHGDPRWGALLAKLGLPV